MGFFVCGSLQHRNENMRCFGSQYPEVSWRNSDMNIHIWVIIISKKYIWIISLLH